MLHPVGQLPRNIYWRRRVIVLLVFAVVAAIVVGLLVGPGGGNDKHTATSTGSSSTVSPRPSGSTPSGSAKPSSVAPKSSAAPTSPTGGSPSPVIGEHTPMSAPGSVPIKVANTPSSGKPSSKKSSAAPNTKSRQKPSPTKTSSSAAKKPAVPTCSDSDLQLTVKTAAPSYHVGKQIVFDLTVTNTSKTTCSRDVGLGKQEILVYSGSNRLWGSNDCQKGVGSNVKTLRPNQAATAQTTWIGETSIPGCSIGRLVVGAGTYPIQATIGTLASTGSSKVVIVNG
ncbi:MAG: hypothetical protein ACR2F6_12975 [Mycobacteriales bacterium]